MVTEYVQDRVHRLSVLKNKQTGKAGQICAAVTLDELHQMQAEVASVAVPDAVNELMDDILCELRSKGIHISDRKYFGYYPLAQAKAWLAGRTTAESGDLIALKYYLWTQPEERAVIDPILTRMCSDPLKEKLDNILQMALESMDSFREDTQSDPLRRIGKFRGEFVRLYEMARALKDSAQSGAEQSRVDELVAQLEDHNQKAYAEVGRDCVSLPSAYEILKSA